MDDDDDDDDADGDGDDGGMVIDGAVYAGLHVRGLNIDPHGGTALRRDLRWQRVLRDTVRKRSEAQTIPHVIPAVIQYLLLQYNTAYIISYLTPYAA